jgi:predicted AAA+ superfamily ATPase
MNYNLERSIQTFVADFLQEKIVLLSGPRQVGKTYLSKKLTDNYVSLNYDNDELRRDIIEKSWPRKTDLVILDEIQKMNNWKQWLKGIYDVEGIIPQILVTGSAQMDTYRKVGDSLAGRHHLLHLLPLSVNEVSLDHTKEVVEQFLKLGQFPEPFLKGNETKARLWRKSHTDIIIRQDLLDLESVKSIKGIENLIDLLSQRVGCGVSYANLARDLAVSAPTIKSWIEILERLFVVYTIRPYSKSFAKSISKEPKVYFHDIGRVKDPGQRLENLVANHLLKKVVFLNDTQGLKCELMYYRDTERREVDFLLTENGEVIQIIEVKTADDVPTLSLRYLKSHLNLPDAYQVVYQLKREREIDGIYVLHIDKFLASLET